MDKLPVVEEYVEEINPENLEDVDEETGETNPNFVYDGEEEVMPMPEKKEPLYRKEDIFVKANQPEPTKPPKKKRVLSEEHKRKLAVAREKALATRRKNADEKKRIKELEKRAKQKKTKELEDYVDDKPPQPVQEKVVEKVVEREPTITKKDLEEAQLEAIIKYETLRKQRKEQKRKKEDEEKKKMATINSVRKATQPRNVYYGESGFFDDCF